VSRGSGGSRGSGAESTVYEVRAKLVEAKIEADSDIHLVIRSLTSSGTMIMEFPLAPSCTPNATAGAKTRMKNARNAFVAVYGMPSASSFEHLKGKATIRAVGFFDSLHGKTGVAPNGIELHPVLKFTHGSCARDASPPSPSSTIPAPTTTPTPKGNCDPSYPTVCIRPPPPDLNCADISYRNFKVLPPDPHHFDGDKDGIGCET